MPTDAGEGAYNAIMKFGLRTATSSPRRRWYQFTLRVFMTGITLLAVTLGAVGLWIAPAERQRAAVAMVLRIGGHVGYSDASVDESSLIRYLREWLPRDYFDAVVMVGFDGTRATDDDLAALQGLTELRELWLIDTRVTDTGLAHLHKFPHLQELWLDGTEVTDTGLVQLQEIPQLRYLNLEHTKVSDSGLRHLANCTELNTLVLTFTEVTDAGLVHLRGVKHLRSLWVEATKVTDAGALEFEKALPGCDVLN